MRRGALHALTDCAAVVGKSPSYLSGMFKQETGGSFVEYIMEYKAGEAKRWLAGTDDRITAIAGAAGSSEQSESGVPALCRDVAEAE